MQYAGIIREEEQKNSDVTKEISANEMAEMLNVKAEVVRYCIRLLKKLGEIIMNGN